MLPEQIEALFDTPPASYTAAHHSLFSNFKQALNQGTIRAAEPDSASPTGWRVNAWVKKGILLGFRMGAVVDMSVEATKLPFFDKSTYPLHSFSVADGIRIVPGGSSIRDGSHIARGVICMPPMFVNVGAYVGENTMLDSHSLVGSCAQLGSNCHISAASQIGGVLEPVGAMPVIIEDDVLVGGNSGIYEGTIVKRSAVLGTGTILNRSIPVYDLVRDAVYSATDDLPLIIPEDAVVIPGSRAVSHPAGKKWGLSLNCAVIVKYRDSKTSTRIQLEDLLR
jgi:2,3,4,5-tetrahydropyridine-2,6-dicarboxylate N-succinyltransferase